MARISLQKKADNLELYSSIVEELFWEMGWFNLKYSDVIDVIKERTNNPKFKLSTLQNYFPHKIDFSEAIKGKVLPVFVGYLDLSSTDKFNESWITALEELKFRRVLSLLIGNLASTDASFLAFNGLNRLTDIVVNELGEDGRKALENLLGKTIFKLSKEAERKAKLIQDLE